MLFKLLLSLMLLALQVALYVGLLAVLRMPNYSLGYTKVSLRTIHYEAQFLTGKQTIEEERKHNGVTQLHYCTSTQHVM